MPSDKPPTAEQIERENHVRAALANNRIEGYPPSSAPEQAIFDVYIRGEIEAKDLVDVVKQSLMGRVPSG